MSFSSGFKKTAVVDLAGEASLMGVFTGPSGYKNSGGARGQMKTDKRDTGQASFGHNRGGNPRAFGEDRAYDPSQKSNWKNSRVPG